MTIPYPLCRKASHRPNIKKKIKKISVLLVLPSSIVYILIANLSMKVYMIMEILFYLHWFAKICFLFRLSGLNFFIFKFTPGDFHFVLLYNRFIKMIANGYTEAAKTSQLISLSSKNTVFLQDFSLPIIFSCAIIKLETYFLM